MSPWLVWVIVAAVLSVAELLTLTLAAGLLACLGIAAVARLLGTALQLGLETAIALVLGLAI